MTELKLGRRFRLGLNKSTIKLNFDFLGLHYFGVLSMHPKLQTIGVSNLCKDGQLVLFADYDNCFYYRVKQDVKLLQEKYDAGSIAILSTGESADFQLKSFGNFHLIGCGKWKFHKLFDALEETGVDRNFLRVIDYFCGHYHVLRIFPKCNSDSWEIVKDRPYLKEICYAETGREMSSGFLKFLQVYYGMPKLPERFIRKEDNMFRLKLVDYHTTSGSWIGMPFSKLFKSGKVNRVLGDEVQV